MRALQMCTHLIWAVLTHCRDRVLGRDYLLFWLASPDLQLSDESVKAVVSHEKC